VLLEGALRFLQPTKARTNEVGTLKSKCQNFSLSPILFLSSSCQVKKKKKKKTLQRNVGRSYSAVGHRSNTLRGPARCRPSQQRREVQRVAGHRSNVATSSALLQQRRKNAASYSALMANAATTLRAVTLPAIAAALRGAAM
jgi:hypothetical protein